LSKEELRLERKAQLTSRGKRYVETILKKLDLGIEENRVRVCEDCLKNAVSKKIKSRESPPPENWSAELWLCYRLRRDGKCPLGLPAISTSK